MSFAGFENIDPDWRKRRAREIAPERRSPQNKESYSQWEIAPQQCYTERTEANTERVALGGKVQVLIIPDIAPSLNEYGRSTKGKRKSNRLINYWHAMVAREVQEQGIEPVKSYPVFVDVECYFGPGRTRFDWDNLSPTPKLIQDGLVLAGILRNDSARYVIGGSLRALKTNMESYTLFKIHEAP